MVKHTVSNSSPQGRMQDFSMGGGGGPNFKISGIMDIHAASSESNVGGFGGMPPRKFLKMVQFRAF